MIHQPGFPVTDRCIPFQNAHRKDAPRIGGKGAALADLAARGIPVPPGCCLPTDVYSEYIQTTGLKERILMELNRKPFEEMRWEEMWDASLRIRNLFLKTPLPPALYRDLHREISALFADRPVAVRSSAPGEDTVKTSFAGLHESFINIIGANLIIDRILLVWASLWSDAALLYRRELSLDIAQSSMAVVIQEFVRGESSGIVFSENPQHAGQAVVEAVWGLNQGLVDGTIEPDRWIIEKKNGQVIEEHHPVREQYLTEGKTGVTLSTLPPIMSGNPPLSSPQVHQVFQLAREIEQLFGNPQDLEWTFRDQKLFLLQARPITTGGPQETDHRSWYLSLRRSIEDLRDLRHTIENQLIPRMQEEGLSINRSPLDTLSPAALAGEIRRRKAKLDEWTSIYWEKFIPFAHGIRLFGQFYNDTVRPDDPFEFVDLLQDQPLESMKRNAQLTEIAQSIQNLDPAELQMALEGHPLTDPELQEKIDHFLQNTGAAFAFPNQTAGMLKFFQEFSGQPLSPRPSENRTRNADRLLDRFSGSERETVQELLDLARTSYRLRDDDNIYLGRFEQALEKALVAARTRIRSVLPFDPRELTPDTLAQALENPQAVSRPVSRVQKPPVRPFSFKSRQITGQPASAGVATGRARVLSDARDVFSFQKREILVCDAIDPTMTFLIPLCSAIVERRGGMLIHGAIIAREYGIPCVTGITDATQAIRTGTRLTVDGHLGIVTIYGEESEAP